MLRSGIRKIQRDIASRKFRTFLVSASIFVGVLGVIGLFTASNLITQQLEHDLDEDRLSMIDLRVSVANDAQLDNTLYLQTLNQQNDEGRGIAALNGVEVVEGWARYPLSFKHPNEDRFQDGELRAYSAPLQAVYIEPLRLLDGEWAQVGQQQVMLEVRMAEKHGFQVGDEIVFRAVGPEGTREATYTISGILFDAYSTRGLARDQPGPTVGIYFQYEDARSLLSFNGFTQFVARYETYDLAQQNFEDFVSTVSDVTPYVPVVPGIEDPQENAQVATAEIFIGLLNSLGLATAIVAGFLVINVINTIVVEQRRQIGILKTVGATETENFLIYAGMAFAYGLIGTILALVPGILVGQLITSYLAPSLDVRITGFNWSPSAVILGVLMGLLVPTLSAALPVWGAARISIMRAITDLGISADYGQGFIPRLIHLFPLPISLRQSLSNVYQKRWRLALTGTTLTLTAAIFMATLAVIISVSDEIRNIFDRLGYQILVIPNELHDQAVMQAKLEAVDGVERASPAALVFVQLPGDYINFFTGDNQVQIFGLDPTKNVLAFQYKDGEGWSKDPTRSGIVISQAIANKLNLKAGDPLTLTIGGKPHETEVIGVDSNAWDGANMRWDEIARLAGMVNESDQPTPNGYYVVVDQEDASIAEVDKVIEAISESLLNQGLGGEFINQVEQADFTVSSAQQTLSIFFVGSILIGTVGAIGLLTTLTISVFERQKEIGVMRSLGAGSGTVAAQFITEGIMVGVVSWLFGLPLSYVFAQIFIQIADLDDIPFTYSPLAPLIGLISLVMIATLASLGPSLGAARKTVSEILRYQ